MDWRSGLEPPASTGVSTSASTSTSPSLCCCLGLLLSVLELFGFVRDIFRAKSEFNLPIKAIYNFRNFYLPPYPGPLLMKKDRDFQ